MGEQNRNRGERGLLCILKGVQLRFGCDHLLPPKKSERRAALSKRAEVVATVSPPARQVTSGFSSSVGLSVPAGDCSLRGF